MTYWTALEKELQLLDVLLSIGLEHLFNSLPECFGDLEGKRQHRVVLVILDSIHSLTGNGKLLRQILLGPTPPGTQHVYLVLHR